MDALRASTLAAEDVLAEHGVDGGFGMAERDVSRAQTPRSARALTRNKELEQAEKSGLFQASPLTQKRGETGIPLALAPAPPAGNAGGGGWVS